MFLLKLERKILQLNLKWYFNGICKTIQREIEKGITIFIDYSRRINKHCNLSRTISEYYNFFPYFSLICIANTIEIQFWIWLEYFFYGFDRNIQRNFQNQLYHFYHIFTLFCQRTLYPAPSASTRWVVH